MKLKNIIKSLSIILAFLVIIVALPIGATAASPEEHETGYDDEITADIQEEQSLSETAVGSEESDPADEEYPVEFETEVFYDEFEIEDTAMSAPPMTQIGDVADPNALAFLPDGVYAIENVANDNYYMSVEGGYAVAGYRMVQEKYLSNTPLTDFSRVSLFKVSRVGNTNQYVIRSMLNNRMSPVPGSDVDTNKFITGYVNTDDASVTTTYTIIGSEGVYSIRPYGSMNVLAAPNTTVSGSGNSTEAQLILTTQSAAGDRGKWRFTLYTGNTKYGITGTQTGGLSNGLVKGKTANVWIKAWSTVIGDNAAYLSVTSATSSIASSSWNVNSGGATITGLKCGDFQMKAEIRSGSSQTTAYSKTYNFTVIPDIAGETGFLQNVATSKYAEIENASMAVDGVIQQSSFHTQPYMRWIFELDGNGYFRIKSEHSGLYLGAYSINPEKVRQYATITDYTRWKFIETSTGNYQIYCKAAGTRNMALALPSTTSADGVDLTNLIYTNDSSYNDEWRVLECKILNDVPTYLSSNATHYCIPCAITNIAGYWSVNGYSQFACSTSSQQETMATTVQARMISRSNSSNGHKANANIHYGFECFSHTDNNKKYILQSSNIWKTDALFSIETLVDEIDSGRPIMMGFANTSDSPYNMGHMTVCNGYEWDGSVFYVYVSDAHQGTYRKILFNSNTYNDFIAVVVCVLDTN